MTLNRRTFLQSLAACGCTSLFHQILRPQLVFASLGSGGGSIDHCIHIVLNGGFDGTFAVQFVDQARRNALAGRRQLLVQDPAANPTTNPRNAVLRINPGSQSDASTIFGLHPTIALNPGDYSSAFYTGTLPPLPTPNTDPAIAATGLHDLFVRNEGKIVPCVGHLAQNREQIIMRSHPQALNFLMAGTENYTSHGVQWLQRIREIAGLTRYQVFRFGDQPGLPAQIPIGKEPALSLPRGISDFDFLDEEHRQAARTLSRILELQEASSPQERDLGVAITTVGNSVPDLQLIPGQTLGNEAQFYGSEAGLFIDAAKVIKARVTQRSDPRSPFYVSGAPNSDSGTTFIQIGLHGFDHHGGLIPATVQYGLPPRMYQISRNIAAIRNALRAVSAGGTNAWARTAVVISSEFGRSLTAGSGSEHGVGNLSMVFSGSLAPGNVFVGTPPTVNELLAPDQAGKPPVGLPTRIDYRDLFATIFGRMNVDTSRAFPEFPVQPVPGLFL